MEKQKKIVQENEIDLIELMKLIWARRKFISKVTAFFLVLGIIIAFTSKVEFEASCMLLPQNQETSVPNLKGLGGLASLAGFDISGFSGNYTLAPELYPEIAKSVPFLSKLIHTPIYFENKDTTVSSFDYFKEMDRPSLFGLIAEYTIGMPGKIKKLFSSSDESELKDYDLVRFTKEEWKILKKYKDRLSVEVDSKMGIISVSVEMPDAVASAMIADLLVKELTHIVINYKIEKSQINLEFVEGRFLETKKKYESKQEQIARFTDRNHNMSNSIIQTEYERLQNELNIAFEVYKSLATQLEQAKIKIKDETPIFSVLEPVRVPGNKSKPKRFWIIFGLLFTGGFIGISIVLLKNIIQKIS